MRRRRLLQSFVSFASSVRVRLTLWYLAVVAFIMVVFGGTLYASQTIFNANASESRIETQLYADTQHLGDVYKQAILQGQAPSSLHIAISSGEIVLLLRSDGTILDARGPLVQ